MRGLSGRNPTARTDGLRALQVRILMRAKRNQADRRFALRFFPQRYPAGSKPDAYSPERLATPEWNAMHVDACYRLLSPAIARYGLSSHVEACFF
jgi:hypothetical protein